MAEYSVICAVALGKTDLVAAAVTKGCNVNATFRLKNTCLHYDIKKESVPVACVFAVFAEYVTPPMMAEYVMYAVALGKAILVVAAVAKGCNMNETDPEKYSCLHLAAKQAGAGPCSEHEFLSYTKGEEDAHAEIVSRRAQRLMRKTRAATPRLTSPRTTMSRKRC
jgi:hypothetical protein